MVTVSENADAYQSLARLRERVEYEGGDFFSDNEQLRFDELLVKLEAESRAIFENLYGDVTPKAQDGRIDERQAVDNKALSLPYPIRDVTEVEVQYNVGGDFETLDTEWYSHTEHHLILDSDRIPRTRFNLRRQRGIERFASQPGWLDLCERLRVTYDRGFESIPQDILSVQVQIVNNLLRQLRLEQNVEAAAPDEYRAMTDGMEVVTDEIKSRISSIASPGRSTMAV